MSFLILIQDVWEAVIGHDHFAPGNPQRELKAIASVISGLCYFKLYNWFNQACKLLYYWSP